MLILRCRKLSGKLRQDTARTTLDYTWKPDNAAVDFCKTYCSWKRDRTEVILEFLMKKHDLNM